MVSQKSNPPVIMELHHPNFTNAEVGISRVLEIDVIGPRITQLSGV